MSKTLQETFKSLMDLKLDYSSANIIEEYWKEAAKIEIDDYLDYSSDRKRYFAQTGKDSSFTQNSFFHVVLSVQVSSDPDPDTKKTLFVPFYSIIKGNELIKGEEREGILKKGKENINYNYSDFLSAFFRLFNQKYGGYNENAEVPRCAFTVDFLKKNITDFSFLPRITNEEFGFVKDPQNDITKGLLNQKEPGKGDLALEELTKELFPSETQVSEEKRPTFVQILSEYYHDHWKIDTLRYTFFNMDSDCSEQANCLARLMIISTDPDEVKFFISKLLYKVREIVGFIRSRYVYDLIQKNKYEAIKSAVSAIMSRNMSHNLGSHYLYYTKNQLIALAEGMEERGPEIRGAAKVLEYMQARMDYLATIVAGDKYPYGGVYFKGQIYDELTIDDFSRRHYKKTTEAQKRTTNYLLQNLVMSENFTRPAVSFVSDAELERVAEKRKTDKTSLLAELIEKDYVAENKAINLKKISEFYSDYPEFDPGRLIKLQVIFNGQPFTGTQENIKTEESVKIAFSKCSVALPGGVMSIHAFFNVVENVIRNSAKYLKEDFNEKEGLVVTIAVKKKKANGQFPESYEFLIFDNKNNALKELPLGKETAQSTTLLRCMNEKLKSLQVLNSNNSLEKKDKGIKEMLFSVLWMRAYTYSRNQTLADVLVEIDRKEGEEKFKEIKYHAFEYVAVDQDGKVVGKNNTPKGKLPKDAHLGVRFYLPVYRMMEVHDLQHLRANLVTQGLNNFTDIICVHGENKPSDGSNDKKPPLELLKRVFTRVYYDEELKFNEDNADVASNAVAALTVILNKRFDHFDEYKLSISKRKEAGYLESDPGTRRIFFKSHLGNDQDDEKAMKENFYSEAISGGNFTKTMESLLLNGIDVNGHYLSDDAKYFGLKVKEAALTRITLIDERFYNNMLATPNHGFVMTCKNVRLLNLKSKAPAGEDNEVKDLFDGNDFRDGTNGTHFLSIHLGLVEKIVGDEDWCKAFGIANVAKKERPFELMKYLRNKFQTDKGEVFIVVHSGRGNFSEDLEGPLKDYPFVSIAAIESVLANSKYLLAQLFYDTVYLGKGRANQPNQLSSESLESDV